MNASYHKEDWLWLNSSWLCPAPSGVEVEEVNEPVGPEVDWVVSSFTGSELWGGGTGCKRPTVAPSRRWRERSPARKRAYSFGVCRSSMAIFGELRVWMSRPIKSKISFSWPCVKNDENSGRRSFKIQYNTNCPHEVPNIPWGETPRQKMRKWNALEKQW